MLPDSLTTPLVGADCQFVKVVGGGGGGSGGGGGGGGGVFIGGAGVELTPPPLPPPPQADSNENTMAEPTAIRLSIERS
ncbi:hypothetical protein D7D48_05305 [Sphingorhabdus wooponensis]|uniref:Uncharacterized protein n=1 Tax=Sphingorhabdus wooponensis TaxID=940136 RepID=A0A3R8S5H4_9SPHN|nr:hypothetical protein D7D48_05305 [Sphingorhabdus wooponensis]